MAAFAAAAIVTAGVGAYKVIDGANQKKQAEALAKNNHFIPQQMPGEVQLATNLAAQNYYNGMPGMPRAQQVIGQNGANAYASGAQGASSGGDLLDLASKINGSQNVATNDLVARGAQYKAQALGGYQNALNTQGQWQDKLYNNNVLQPYLRTANTAASMYGAGAQNQFSGLDTIGTAALGYASSQQKNSPDSQYTMGQVNGTSGIPSLTAPQVTQGGLSGNSMFQSATPTPNIPKSYSYGGDDVARLMAMGKINKSGY